MPYTPPSHRSPSSSAPASPDVSRRPSLQSGSRPSLPRSASYLTKHRRTPSALGQGNGTANTNHPTPPGTSVDLQSLASSSSIGSVRQSPPPVTDDRGMPKGAVISPPDSASSGSEDERPEIRGRRLTNLKELKNAISQIPQHRSSSPSNNSSRPTGELHVVTTAPQQLQLGDSAVEGMHHSFSTGSLPGLAEAGSRRVSHARSSTEPNAVISQSAEVSLSPSEDESDCEPRIKPQMVRKKSGELVRPALRGSSRRRPSSMPGTPTFSKTVHFDSHEHVRHFLQVDRPLAVSAGSSPADTYESETEYPFPEERSGTRSPPYEWEIITNKFPAESPMRKALPVRLERVWLSSDQRSLMGSIDVANLAFQKFVVCRFTLDYWKTTSEVAAEFSHEIRPRETAESHDRFNFTIKLSDLANLESKTLYFCLRYNVNGQEHWDNNHGTNFQVDFRKKHLPQNGKKNFQGASARPLSNGGALPRSTRRAAPSTAPRPKSMPAGALDEFGEQANFNFDQPIHEYLGETTTLRLKSSKSTSVLPSDNLSGRLSAPSGQAFSNRYDFGASLTAAVQAAKDTFGKDRDNLYMKSHKKAPVAARQPERKQSTLRETASDPTGMASMTSTDDKAVSEPPAAPAAVSPNPALASSSYEELVNKYCFFGSKPSSPQAKDGTLRSGRYYDGTDEGFSTHASSTANSSLGGSPLMHHAGAALHHSLHPRDSNPYFHPVHVNGAYTSAGASSPLRNLGSQAVRPGSPSKTANSHSAPATLRSSSPALTDAFVPFAGTSPSQFPFAQHLQERFPFTADAHPATASCG